MREDLSCKIYEPTISRPAYREFLRYLYTGRCGPTADVIDGMSPIPWRCASSRCATLASR